jgi:hypothetical protein
MRPTITNLNMNAVRSEALFVSPLQPSDDPSVKQVKQAIARAVRKVGGRGCAERVAQEFGDHPDLAVARMRWARGLVDETFGARRRARPPRPSSAWEPTHTIMNTCDRRLNVPDGALGVARWA